MKLKLIIFFLGIGMMLFACSSQQTAPVSHVRNMGNAEVSEGFFYMLPRTVATVEFAVTRIESTPGPFAEYAGRYLGLEDIVNFPTVVYNISQVSINSFSEPDPEHVYFAPFSSLQQESFFVSLSESGLIQSVNNPIDNTENIYGNSKTRQFGMSGTDNTFNHFIDNNLLERIDTITEQVRLDTITVERQTLRRSWVEKSIDIRAREVADHIIQIRNKKFDLISGFAEIPYSREAIEYMYNEMSAREEDYLKLFTGITTESTINYLYTVIPDAASAGKPQTLFRFSPREGVLDANRQDGYPVSLVMHSGEATRSLSTSDRPAPSAQNLAGGFYYRIPEQATVILREGNNLRAEARILVNQFGVISRMAPQGMQIEFYPGTGSIKSIGTTQVPTRETK